MDLDEEKLTEWRLSQTAVLEIGVNDGDSMYQFHSITEVARLSNGQIVVANSGSHQIRLYSPDGRHIRNVGGHGFGPGEFRSLGTMLHLPLDTILVQDRLQSRLNFYSPSLEHVRTTIVHRASPIMAQLLGRLADGRWLGLTLRLAGDRSDSMQFAGVVVAFSNNGASVDTLLEYPGEPAYFERCGPLRQWRCRLRVPFAPSRQAAQSGDRLVFGNGATFELQVADAGVLTEIWKVDADLRPVTVADIQAERATLLRQARSEEAKRRIRRSYEARLVPKFMPAYSRIVADAAGNFWVEKYRAPRDAARTFIIFSSSGEILAKIGVPDNFVLHQMHQDHVIGVAVDTSGAEVVRLYSLHR
jgi:hypothetical protein